MRSTKKLSVLNILGFSIALLLVAQLYWLPLIPKLVGSNYNAYAFYVYVYIVTSYLGITLILLIEIQNLQEFNIDRLTLWIIIFSCFLRRRLGIEGEIFYLLFLAFLGISIFGVVFIKRNVIPKTSTNSLLGGVAIGFIALTLTTLIEAQQASNWLTPAYSNNVTVVLVRELIYQLSFVTIVEEIVFRGFLVGYLKRFGCKENIAFVVQALLFWLIHYASLGNPLTFFLSIPILIISTTLVVRWFKQLSPSIFIHTFVNVFLPFLLNLLFS